MNEQRKGFFREKLDSIHDLPRNLRRHNKVATELGLSALSFFLMPIGPSIIAGVNAWNTYDEAKGVHDKKENASVIRTGMYGLATLAEIGVQFAGVHFGAQEAAFITQHIGLVLPDLLHPVLGLFAGGGAGMITGAITNTTFWEARRGKPSIMATIYRSIRDRLGGK